MLIKRTLDWSRWPNFGPVEFPEDPNQYADGTVIEGLQIIRNATGFPVYPSPAKGALARCDTNSIGSAHYSNPAIDVYSRAVDFFCEGNPVDIFHKILMSGAFWRIGVYFDTVYCGKPWVMFHGDDKTESKTRLWFRDEAGNYHYPQNYPTYADCALFLELLGKRVKHFYTKM